jgi:hypothetical protein
MKEIKFLCILWLKIMLNEQTPVDKAMLYGFERTAHFRTSPLNHLALDRGSGYSVFSMAGPADNEESSWS